MTDKKTGRVKVRQTIKYAVLILLAIILTALAPTIYSVTKSLVAWRQVEDKALTVLQGEQLSFLVTDRISSQIMVESDENNPVLGIRRGFLIARARLYFGVDLGKLTRQDISREELKMVVHVPDPEELDFAVDLESIRYLTQRSGLQILTDWIMDRDQKAELRAQFKAAAYEYLREEGLVPEREKIVSRLNGFSGLISDNLGVEVVFR